MTDHTTQPEATLLWSDERINDLAYQMSESIRTDAFGGGERQIRGALKQVRDDVTTTLQQENARLAEDKAMLQARVWELDAELAALRAEARYAPVVYSTFVEDQSHNDTYLLVTLGGTQLEMGTDPTAGGVTVNLPSDMRLCRLVPGQDTQTSSHGVPSEVKEIISSVLEDERDRHIINGGLAANRKELEAALKWIDSLTPTNSEEAQHG